MTDAPAETEYRVLARKYRPQTFADLIGQEAMVRTLSNAFAHDRIAHAFVLTGVRGVGKTTTARIVAKGLNCIGPDGQGGPTVAPCGSCAPCRAIAEGRHVDVLEIDAATHTQVDRMREILAGVPYRPTEVRYKVYVIDEVHMLSPSSFNALLKTLEEPPEHVKFIFATTEIRKVPVTVLSRCQRFDLRRIEPEEMLAHLGGIAEREGAEVAPDALALITRAAEGSVRDALSLLDQAIAHGSAATGAAEVRAMLGLADRGRVLDLFEMIMGGDASGALAELSGQYAAGADPLAVLRDLAEVTHWVSMLRIAAETADDPTVAPDERDRGLDFARRLGMPTLTRAWAMLLKALEEVAAAPNAMMAAEMAIIRLTHVADLPSPEDLVRRLQGAPSPAAPAGGSGGSGGVVAAGGGGARAMPTSAARLAARPAPAVSAETAALARYGRFEDVVALVRARRDMAFLVEIEAGVRLAAYSPGRIEFEPADGAAPDLAARLAARLKDWTGVRWVVSVVGSGGGATLAETRATEAMELEARARAHPLVAAMLETFPGMDIREVRPQGLDEAAPPAPDDDDFDPFAEES